MMDHLRPNIPYVDLVSQYTDEREDLLPIIDRVLSGGQWVGGDEVAQLETELASDNGVEHAVTLGSGTDALILGLRALGVGPGDEVITPPNSFVSSASAIHMVGARPVFADVLPDQNIDPAQVEAKITKNTKAVMPVHLTGRCADMVALGDIAKRHDFRIIEDAAQAYGSEFQGRRAGTIGDIGCFSAHPLKNLNAAGDAGFVLCQKEHLAEAVRLLRNNGMQDRNTVAVWGTVSRLDTLQAAILRYRLKKVQAVISARRRNAKYYQEVLDSRHVFMPKCAPDELNTFHTFVVQVDRRDDLQKYLLGQGIGSGVHYPRPIHLQPAAASLGYQKGDFPVAEAQAERIISLPIHPGLSQAQIETVGQAVNEFYR